jgi:hypothetical protein
LAGKIRASTGDCGYTALVIVYTRGSLEEQKMCSYFMAYERAEDEKSHFAPQRRCYEGHRIFGFARRLRLALSSNSPMGMTGFDSVNTLGALLRSGMATVPDTHLLQP